MPRSGKGSNVDGGVTGARLEGYLDALSVPRKAVAAESGIHESTLSRIISGQQIATFEHGLKIGQAIQRVIGTKAA